MDKRRIRRICVLITSAQVCLIVYDQQN